MDDMQCVVIDPRGQAMNVAIADLMGIAIETNDSGPWGADVWWLLFGKDGKLAYAFPQGASGETAALDRLMKIPGFDYEEMIRAMVSTDNAVFPVWSANPT